MLHYDANLSLKSLRLNTINEVIGSSLIYNTGARYERHKCKTSATLVT